MAKRTTPPKAPTAPTLPDIEVIDQPVSEDHGLLLPLVADVRSFIGGLVPFFRGAIENERLAKERFDQVAQIERELKAAHPKNIALPRDEAEDLKVQAFIRDSRLGRKKTDDTWGITSVLSRLHKATVAGRDRAGKFDDDALAISQRMHNEYTEHAKRVAREEEQRINQERERLAAQERETELARLEEAAVRAEAASPDLSTRESQFVDFYVLDIYAGSSQGNAEEAARRAGFRNPVEMALRLTRSDKVQGAIKAKQEAEGIRRQAAAKKEAPLEVRRETVKPAIARGTGLRGDRTTWSADVYDPELFMAALLDPRERMRLGIPADCATFVQTKLNELATALHEKMDVWPGVRAKKNTSTS